MSINAPPSPRQILCIDDSGDDCELFTFILSQAGYQVKSAQSVRGALQLLENSLFNLCLFDIRLPDGTGFDLIEKVRAIDPSIPLIICSADARGSTRQQAMQAGVQAFFTKPFDYDSLVETIAQLIQCSCLDFSPSMNLDKARHSNLV